MTKTHLKFLGASITLLLVFSAVYAEGEDPGYSCFPNGTVTIPNPNSTLYTSVIATYNDGTNVHLCSVDGVELIVITNCNLTFDITVVFSDRANSSDNIEGGKNINACRLKCNMMTMHTISFNNTFEITLPVTVKEAVTPRYSISAGFFNESMSGSPVYIASIGENIIFSMSGPIEYYLRPIQCIAYNNPSKALSTSNKTLINNGCTEDDKLMSDFNRTEFGTEFKYESTFCVFKFYQSNDLYIECSVKVCPIADGCGIDCSEDERKKRQVMSAYEGLSGHDSRLALIGRRLRIADEPLGGSSQMHGSIWLSVLAFAIMISQTCW